MTATQSVFTTVDEIEQSTVFYGNYDAVVTAMREISFHPPSAYLEISSPIVSESTLNAIKHLDSLIPTHVLFNDFDSADEPTQQRILQLLQSRSHNISVMAAFSCRTPPANGDFPPAQRVYHVADFDTCTEISMHSE